MTLEEATKLFDKFFAAAITGVLAEQAGSSRIVPTTETVERAKIIAASMVYARQKFLLEAAKDHRYV